MTRLSFREQRFWTNTMLLAVWSQATPEYVRRPKAKSKPGHTGLPSPAGAQSLAAVESSGRELLCRDQPAGAHRLRRHCPLARSNWSVCRVLGVFPGLASRFAAGAVLNGAVVLGVAPRVGSVVAGADAVVARFVAGAGAG